MNLRRINILLITSLIPFFGNCQEKKQTRDFLIVAKEMMMGAQNCALITINSSGYPSVRMMDPLPPSDGFIVWLATNPSSRKVAEIMNNPKTTLYYTDNTSPGYVSLIGHAYIVDEPEAKQKFWKDAWTPFYPDKTNGHVLIRFEPLKIEMVSYKDGVISEKSTWEAPSTTISQGGSN